MNARLETVARVAIAMLVAITVTSGGPESIADVDDDLAAARELFERNLDAIKQRDREAYLACYLQTDALVRTGPTGYQLGFADHAAQSSDSSWPDVFEGRDLRLTPIESGIVYGTYRYRVSYAGDEHRGISERLFVKTDDGWKIALTGAIDTPGTPPPPLAIVGATLVDGTGAPPVPNAVVVIRDGRIDCAGTANRCAIPDGIDTIEAQGMWITPGLIDTHVHFSQTGWADGRPDSLDVRDLYPYAEVQAGLRANPERFLRSYLCSGVTAVFDVGGYPWTWELPERTESDTLAPHVAAAGPLLSTLDFWLNLPAERQFIHLADEAAGRDGVDYLAAHGTDAVKVWFINLPDRDFDQMAASVKAAGDAAVEAGIPLIVHATGLDEAKASLRAGAKLLVHSVWDQPVDDEFIDLAKANGTIYCPTLTVIDGYRRMYESVVSGEPPIVDDPNGCIDPVTLERVANTPRIESEDATQEVLDRRTAVFAQRKETMDANLTRVHEAGIPIAMGSDAGNPLTLHGPSVYAEMEAMQTAGLTAAEVLVTATRGGAMALDRLDDLGTIEPGKIADLLIVEADPIETIANLRRLRFVMRAGVMRSVEELRPLPPSP
jgi:imidazolonepropionase-like amidohydrolase